MFASGVLIADFGSGLVHWGADTWGRDDLPVIGPRLLVPFRVHHVNPEDFLRRNFADTNGDVALIAFAPIVALCDAATRRGVAALWPPSAVSVCAAPAC